MIYSVIEIIATLFDAVFFTWFIPSFLHTKFYLQKKWTWVFPFLVLASILIFDRLLPGFDLLAIIIALILALLYAMSICNKKWFRAVFAAASYILVIMFGSSLVFAAFSIVPDFSAATGEVMQGNASIARIVYLVFAKLSQFIVFQFVLLAFKKSDNLDKKNGVFVFLYSLATIIGLGALMSISVSDIEGKSRVATSIVLLVLVASLFSIYIMIRQVMKMQRQEYEYKLMQEKMNAEKARAEDADAIWENIRRVRHDMRNHFTVLKGKLKEGDLKSCEEYIDEIYPTIESVGNLVHTGNAVIDYLINTKFSKDKEIQIIVSGFAEIYGDIEDADLASMLGNILDNAFEAVAKLSDPTNKRIELYFLKQNQNRIILCKNSIENSVLQSNKDLRSTKRGNEHGYGHKIVATVAEKYGGFVEYLENNGMFCVQIILPDKTE